MGLLATKSVLRCAYFPKELLEAVIENPGLMPETREGIDALARQDVRALGVWHPT
jgi:hypothetical protein